MVGEAEAFVAFAEAGKVSRNGAEFATDGEFRTEDCRGVRQRAEEDGGEEFRTEAWRTRRRATKLPGHVRSQVQLGNEGKITRRIPGRTF